MKKIRCFFVLIIALTMFFSCGKTQSGEISGYEITDFAGNTAVLSSESRIVSCYASFTDCFLLAGGEVVGITDDCYDRGIVFGNSPEIVGSTKIIDVEKVVSLRPDYVILSYDLTSHKDLEDVFESMNIPCGYFRMDTFGDYKNLMHQFTGITGREELYKKNVTDVEERINHILSLVPEDESRTALLLRAYSTGMKAKRDDNLAGIILNEYNITNIADIVPSLMEELSAEAIIKEDPDYIFVMSMGDEEAAREYIEKNITTHAAYSSLTAVKEGRFHILPQELFHYKPNEKWDQSYEYLAKIIWPELF